MAKCVLSMLLVLVTAAAASRCGETLGWRGDGTGIHANVEPPIHWQRVSAAVAGLRSQAALPPAPSPPREGVGGGGEPSGQSMPDGVVREWLLLGPVPAEEARKGALKDALLAEDQSKLFPAAGQEFGSVKWKAWKAETAFIDCAHEYGTYGQIPDLVAYAHAYIYSPAEAGFIIRIMHTGTAHLWLNGRLTHKGDQTDLNYSPQMVKLQKGWNRLLVRIAPQRILEQDIVLPWFTNVVFEAAPDKAEYRQQGIAWKVPLPSAESFGGPIVVAGRVFLLCEMSDLVCLDAATGKILWLRSNNYHELATGEEKQAPPELFKEIEPLAARLKEVNASFMSDSPPKSEAVGGHDEYKEKAGLERKLYELMRKVDGKKYALPKGQDVGYSGLTPASDGKRIYAWFATGVTCCYDLDGNCIWRRLDNEGSFPEHGYSSSPLLADGKLIVFMTKLLAFDAEKGQRLWADEFSQGFAQNFHGTPVSAKIGGTTVCVLPTGHILRVSDGKILRDKGPEIIGVSCEVPSPVVLGDTIYRLSISNQLLKTVLPPEIRGHDPNSGELGIVSPDFVKVDSVRTLKIDVSHYPTYYLTWHLCSPLVADGLAYCVNNTGVLTVVDVEKMQVVYEKLLDLDTFQTAHEGPGRGVGVSPAFAGGRIYVLGNTGSTLVLKPGRKYEELAKNKIECVFWRYWGLRHERFISAPAFEGKRMFIRGDRHLYCLSGG